jgi:cytochrome c553
MPVFRFLDAADDSDHVEARALFAFTRSVPPVNRHTPQGPPREAPRADSPPERLFATLGCATCHGDGAPRHADLKTAAAKPIETIVDNIRNPEKFRARTPMPTYAAAIDDATARKIATWIQTTSGRSSGAAK